MITRILILTLFFSPILTGGCAGIRNHQKPAQKKSKWDLFPKSPSATQTSSVPWKKSKPGPAQSMAVIWKDSTPQINAQRIRGFEGQVNFYDAQDNLVKAEGDLIIYGFDDSDGSMKSKQPTKKFVFPAEDLEKNLVDSGFGPSYRVWIPWEPVGGYRKAVNLIPVFRTTEGQIVNAESSVNTLPGAEPPIDQAIAKNSIRSVKSANLRASLASHQRGDVVHADQLVADSQDFNRVKIKSSTIPLTPTLTSRLSAPIEATTASHQAVAREKNDSEPTKDAGQQATPSPTPTPTPSPLTPLNRGDKAGSGTSLFSPESPIKSESVAPSRSPTKSVETSSSTSIFGQPGPLR